MFPAAPYAAGASTALFSHFDYKGSDDYYAENPLTAPTQLYNPILPGWNSDPSICRTGSDYWLVTSTFGYFPGLPLYHSTDLVNWSLVRNVLENPYAGFRIYMNESQAIDLYLKNRPGLELEQTSFYSDAAAVAKGMGCDVLRVGKSVGAGSFRGFRHGKACGIDTVSERTMRVPDNSTVELIDRGWVYGDHSVDMEQTYTVSASTPALSVRVRLSGYKPGDMFCTGVQKLDSDNKGYVRGNIEASWGSNAPDSKHPELIETVGLAVEVDSTNVAGVAETETDYLLILRPDSNGEIRYRIIADVPRAAEGAKTAKQWFAKVKNFFQSNK